MNTFKYIFILFFTSFVAQAQYVVAGSSPVTITFTADYFNASFYFQQELIVTNLQDVAISGSFIAEEGVYIKPMTNTTILLVPTTTTSGSPHSNNADSSTDVNETKIGAKKGGSTGKVTIFPNPVQANLSFSLDHEFVDRYEIYDATGQIITSQTIVPTQSNTIAVYTLPSNATYILKLHLTNNTYLNVQFIKN
ncbi:T9SS type A sorting domain-containing protein [Flavobacterium branchiophilum]|uniref:Secretion system C-terminal sorting domain-containing protein n=1 Tax=Flavobacterium branchiophilum TaxID=55197 RepID=A0A2H3KBV9_9FLAO|nr:T9SS type A sorting domain-containing protein [Flavobacterium branchiophilum]PDS23417.1 hypothetical protein B0A77_10970 [Flavobacterium branchiophilum]